MTAQLVHKSHVETIVTITHEFEHADVPGAGYGFDLNESGERINSNPAADENYRQCIAGLTDRGTVIIDKGIQRYERDYRHPAVYKCRCGEEFAPAGYDYQCECGQWYNGSAQELDSHAMECSVYANGFDCMCGEGE